MFLSNYLPPTTTMGWPRPPRSSAPWLYSAAETGLEEEEGPEGLRKRGDGRREMWGHQQHVGWGVGGGGDAFVFKIFWRGSNKGRGERGQEGGGEMRWLEVGGGGGGG